MRPLFAAIAVLTLLFAGCVQAPAEATATPQPTATPTLSPLEERLAAEADANRTARPNYFGNAQDQVFAELPAFPTDFYRVRTAVKYGLLQDLSQVSDAHYKQPEFVPGFEENGVRLMQSPPAGRFGGFGFGAYPGDIVVQTRPGETFTVATFFYTSWLVETRQGMQLAIEFPATASFPAAGTQPAHTVTQDPDAARAHFTVTTDPSVFLLEPAFPRFHRNWIQRVIVRVTVSPDTPPGAYVIGLSPTAPPAEQNQAWVLEHLNAYVPAGGTGVGRPFVQIGVRVS